MGLYNQTILSTGEEKFNNVSSYIHNAISQPIKNCVVSNYSKIKKSVTNSHALTIDREL